MTNKQLTEHQSNGNGNGKHNSATQLKDFNTVWEPKAQPVIQTPVAFKPDDQPVILERPSWWSHAFVWMIVGITGFGLLWAGIAPIDQSVPAQGKLEVEGAAKELRAPNGGVVRDILVKDGDRVKKGQLLVILDPTAPKADLEALLKQRDTLQRETQFYNQVNANGTGSGPEWQALAESRNALVAQNQYYKALLNGAKTPPVDVASGNNIGSGDQEFNITQQGLLSVSRQEIQTRVATVRSQIQQLETQQGQVRGQLEAAVQQLPKARERYAEAKERLTQAKERLANARNRIATAQQLQQTDEVILNQIKPLVEQGAIARLQMQRQEQQILTRRQEINASQSELLEIQDQGNSLELDLSSRGSEILNTQAEIDRFSSEQKRISEAIGEKRQQLQNTIAASSKEVFSKISDNQNRIAEIDGQLARVRLENKKRLDEIDAQIAKAQQAVEYQEVRSPVDGVVFNLKPTGPGYVIRQIDNEPVLTVVPEQSLVAKVYLTNRDIGQVVDRLNKEKELQVEVNVESFPSTEFGTLQGKLVSIGSDVLPPTQERPYYTFPAKIQLTNQTLNVNGKEIGLQSGMAVNASIKVRKRTVLSIFTELFQKQVDNLETVR